MGAQRGEGREPLVAGRDERVDVHKAPPLPPGEVDAPVDQGKQSVVAPPPHSRARVETGASLAHDDRAGTDRAAIEYLYPEALPGAVTPVTSTTAAFGLGHVLKPPW